jgi:hypothetical protein
MLATFTTNWDAGINGRAIGQSGESKDTTSHRTLDLQFKRAELLTAAILVGDDGERLEPGHACRNYDARSERRHYGQHYEQRSRADERCLVCDASRQRSRGGRHVISHLNPAGSAARRHRLVRQAVA